MSHRSLPRIGLLWAQFASYHIDRAEAVGRRFAGGWDVTAVEVATASRTYQWQPSGALDAARKVTLFPGQVYDDIPWHRRLWAQWSALRGCRIVFVGIGYDQPDILCLGWLLRLTGHRVVMLTDSKFDDRPRWVLREAGKALLLRCFHAAIVAGRRQRDFVWMLGFGGRRAILPGMDTISVARVRSLAQRELERPLPFAEREFVFVGRFVPKKNVLRMIEAYARYAGQAGEAAHGLRLVGAGPLEPAMRELVDRLGIAERVHFSGFLPDAEVPRVLAGALALVLVSTEEQWGLVINEAVALGVPVITSFPVGAGDALVRSGENGFLVEAGAVDGIAAAMTQAASSEALWQRLSAASAARGWLADADRFADAVEVLVDAPGAASAAERIGRFEQVLDEAA